MTFATRARGARSTAPATRRPRGRAGFTLIELLVVIAIIALLLALTGVGLQKAVESQKNRSTDDLMNRLQPALDAEYNAVVKQGAKDREANSANFQLVVTYCDGDMNRAEALWTSAKLRQHFPETFAEVAVTATVPVCPGVALPPLKTFAKLGAITGGTPDEQSAALLYAILAEKASGGSGGFAADDVTNGMQMDLSLGGATVKAFRDAWGNPVCFKRWWIGAEVQEAPFVDAKKAFSVAGAPVTGPPSTAVVNRDPLDPRNLVFGWLNPDGTANTAKRGVLQAVPYLFNGNNRVPTVWTYGKNAKNDNLLAASDDLVGARLRRLGNKGK